MSWNFLKNLVLKFPVVVVDQPEVYENPLFTAALDSITSGLLTTGQAAEKFGIRESALIAALSWSDVEQCSVAVPTSSAVTVSTSSLQVVYHFTRLYYNMFCVTHSNFSFTITVCSHNFKFFLLHNAYCQWIIGHWSSVCQLLSFFGLPFTVCLYLNQLKWFIGMR